MKSLKSVKLSMSYAFLDSSLLNHDLFEKVAEINVFGVVSRIDASLFKEFKLLRNLDLNTNNLRAFLHGDAKWMTYLNYYVRVNLSNLNEVTANIRKRMRLRFQYLKNRVSFDPVYEYPDVDLCLFSQFPHDRLVMPILVPGRKIDCTCTLLWLQSYYHFYSAEIALSGDYSDNYQAEVLSNLKRTFKFCDASFNASRCELVKKLERCKLPTRPPSSLRVEYNDVDWFYLIKWLQFVLLTVLQPLMCLFGAVTNLLTVIVIRNGNKKKEFTKPMYKHIQINAMFNIVYCAIMGLRLVNTCIFYGTGIFCSSVYQTTASQRFKMIVIHFFGNAIKTSSNVSYLSFSICRLLLITVYKDRRVTKKKSNALYIVYASTILVASCVLSTFKLFQYSFNMALDAQKDFPFELRNEKYCLHWVHKFDCKLFSLFKIVNRLLNDILFVFLNVCVDLILIKKFKYYLDKKLIHVVDIDHHKQIEKSKKNVNRMIFWNSLIYVGSHLPEFASTLALIVFARKIANFCSNNLSCDLINEEAEFFSLISMVCQFFIFKIYDKNFKSSFFDLKSRIWPAKRGNDENTMETN